MLQYIRIASRERKPFAIALFSIALVAHVQSLWWTLFLLISCLCSCLTCVCEQLHVLSQASYQMFSGVGH
jgi:hypothetical protein